MKKSINALSHISYEYIDELKEVGAETLIKRRSYRAFLIAAMLAVVALCVSLFVIISSENTPPDIADLSVVDSSSDESFFGFASVSPEISTDSSVTSSASPEESNTSNENSVVTHESFVQSESSVPDDTFSVDDTSTSRPPDYNEDGADFTAQQIADIFAVREGDKTNQYEVIAFDDVTEIKTGALPQGDLPMLIESDWKHEYQKLTVGGMEDWALYLEGKTIILSNEASYDEVYSIALEWLPLCQKYFGFDYCDIDVSGSGGKYGFYQIYFYDSSASYPYYQDGRAIKRTNSYLKLDIGSNVDSDIITLRSIVYKAENNSFSEGDRFNTISLEEAEEMLANGYVFGGHTCPICMQAQNMIDFSDYDHVGIEYVQRVTLEDWTNEYYPFYAFYKEIEEGRYARTYVPAFRVGGLEEYFESQKSNHNFSGLIPV